MASDKKVGTHLIFDHALGGGANIYTDERIEQSVKEKKNVLLVQYDFYTHDFKLLHRYKTYDFRFKISNFKSSYRSGHDMVHVGAFYFCI